MKTLDNLKQVGMFLILVVGIAFVFSGCKNNDDPTPGFIQVEEALRGNNSSTVEWKIESLTVNGKDETSLYKDLKITFGAGTYTSTGGTPVWPSTDTWKFTDDSGTKVIRGDGVEITIIEASDTKLKYSFQWSKVTIGAGRSASLSGLHEFTMVR